MRGMKLRDIGEFDLISRMARVFDGRLDGNPPPGGGGGLVVGIGDDTAVWSSPRQGFTIATTDAMVEGVHFSSRTTDWYDLGWKAMASNLSDIAGTGGVPLYALLTLAASEDQDIESIEEMCRGMADLAARYETRVVGGDTVSSAVMMLSVTLIGEATARVADGSPRILSRFQARPGDLIAVTGRLGSSGGGLELMLTSEGTISPQLQPLLDAHRRPLPRVREGQLLVEAGVRCGMDLSDGLAGDLRRVCDASRLLGIVEIERLPIDPLLAGNFGERAVVLALSGGEDYELLCTGPADVIEAARLSLSAIGTELTAVGYLREVDEEGPRVLLSDGSGRLYPPPRSGWEHFSAG